MTKNLLKNYIIMFITLTLLRIGSFEGMLSASLAMIIALLIEIKCDKNSK